jgi:hypothetical protein
MNANDEDCGSPVEAMPQRQPFAGNNDPVAGPVASGGESDGPATASPPSRDRSSDLLKAMYYWVHSRF